MYDVFIVCFNYNIVLLLFIGLMMVFIVKVNEIFLKDVKFIYVFKGFYINI